MVCGRQDRVRTVHMACAAALHTPACVMSLLVQRGTECWKVGFGAWTQGGDSCWL